MVETGRAKWVRGSGAGMCVQVLMDPVCMLTIYPQLLQNFVYKMPRLSANVLGLVDSLRFVFSRDLLVAEVGPSIIHACLFTFLSIISSMCLTTLQRAT